ncbi:MAG: branched-chain-amino-acid transaminase [Anaerolineales bacterium]|nr:branched-chain-amino-acid transaminase [Anaerolineales bacterium]
MENPENNWQVYVNGKILPVSQAGIPVFDRGFEYGDGVFEGLLCYGSRLFKCDEHLDRLYRSATAVRIPIPMTRDEFKEIIKKTVRANGFRHAHIKPFITRGTHASLKDPMEPIKPNIVIMVRELGSGSLYGDPSQGFKLASVSMRKTPQVCLDPRIKCQSFISNVLAWYEAAYAGADEALVLDMQGNVAECGFANIFIVTNGVIRTPLALCCLEGITRGVVIELAKRAGYMVSETTLTPYDVKTADEVFATGTAARISPMVKLDEQSIGDGQVGSVTRHLMELFDKELLTGEPVYED